MYSANLLTVFSNLRFYHQAAIVCKSERHFSSVFDLKLAIEMCVISKWGPGGKI